MLPSECLIPGTYIQVHPTDLNVSDTPYQLSHRVSSRSFGRQVRNRFLVVISHDKVDAYMKESSPPYIVYQSRKCGGIMNCLLHDPDNTSLKSFYVVPLTTSSIPLQVILVIDGVG